MRRKPKPITAEPKLNPNISLHESVPDIAFEMAMYRMRNTSEPTTAILADYLREIGA